MMLEKLQRIVKTFWTLHQTEVVWIIDRRLGKNLIIFGTLDEELYKAMQETLLDYEVEAYNWIVGKMFIRVSVRDKVK